MKYQIKRGDIKIPDGRKSGIGALLAQAEFGDIEKTESSPMFVYPPYFPEQQWNDGISYLIAKEHKRLKGNLIIGLKCSLSLSFSLLGPSQSPFGVCNVQYYCHVICRH